MLVLIQMLSRITLPCHFLLNNFMAAVPSHHCNITALDDEGVFGNLTLEEKMVVGIPADENGDQESCLMFSKPQYQHLSGLNISEDTFTVPCQNGWVYDNSTFKSTLATEALLEPGQTETTEKKYTFVDLFKTPNMRKLSICLGIVWYGVAFTYYGISLNITGFGLNIYLTQLIFASIEIPMKVGVYIFLEKLGRRPTEAGALLATGLCLFINLFVSKDKWLIRTVVAVLGKALSEASFTIIYLYTMELFPTVIRENGLGYTSFLARLAVSISVLVMLLEDVWRLLPAVVYCTVAIGAGLVASLLPETLNVRLPEIIEDIEKPSSLDEKGAFRNLSQAERLIVSIPVQEDGTPSSCQMFAEPQYHLLLNSSNITDLLTVSCQNGWLYDNTTYKSTLATEWDLVCDMRRVNRATATIFFIGVMVGAAVFGYLSDRCS
ncbi:Solute carrier family 22 member 7 [Collichthys lucidus]|uniref:Solute carrier family 22 member 7 n=1 Tax=Collichthys lucidus TaxID=240159 RepID=A0A4U5U3D9_COLLU|nr:Solute carrier family 22 member 7 [Collichthys lucidus]